MSLWQDKIVLLPATSMKLKRNFFCFNTYIRFVIFYTILVIIWGAYVRASSSGAGCGSHWPLCNGQLVPLTPTLKTLIEFVHRITSGLSLVLVLSIGIWTFRLFPQGLFIRKAAIVGMLSILMEAIIGAGLVLFELVYKDQSVKRLFSIVLHFTNTLILVGALTLVAVSATRQGRGFKWRKVKTMRECYFYTLLFFFIGMTGAITALGDTLFPSESISLGIKEDLNHKSHLLIKLRVFHPFIATIFTCLLSPWIVAKKRELKNSKINKLGNILLCLVLVNLVFGICNVLFLAPLLVQMMHLTIAMNAWIVFVLFLDQISCIE